VVIELDAVRVRAKGGTGRADSARTGHLLDDLVGGVVGVLDRALDVGEAGQVADRVVGVGDLVFAT